MNELAELFAKVDLHGAAAAGGDGHGPAAVVPTARGDEPQVVEPEEPCVQPDRALRRLDGERIAGAAAISVEVDPPGEELVQDRRCTGAVEPAVVEPVWQADEVAREPISTDVRRLPQPVGVDLVRQRVVERPAVARAAGIVLAVRAYQQQRVVDELPRSTREIDTCEVLVVLEVDAAKLDIGFP